MGGEGTVLSPPIVDTGYRFLDTYRGLMPVPEALST